MPISKAMTSSQKVLMEKVEMRISFTPDRLRNRHLPAGEIPYLTQKLYLLLVDGTGGHCQVAWVRPKIKGQSLSPSLDSPCFMQVLRAGPISKRHHLGGLIY